MFEPVTPPGPLTEPPAPRTQTDLPRSEHVSGTADAPAAPRTLPTAVTAGHATQDGAQDASAEQEQMAYQATRQVPALGALGQAVDELA
jgi:hypothetical protein